VRSFGGTTAAALEVLMGAGVAAADDEGVAAATRCGGQLAPLAASLGALVRPGYGQVQWEDCRTVGAAARKATVPKARRSTSSAKLAPASARRASAPWRSWRSAELLIERMGFRRDAPRAPGVTSPICAAT
jgi:hypothetical protein